MSVSWQNRRRRQSLVAQGSVKMKQQNNVFFEITFDTKASMKTNVSIQAKSDYLSKYPT